MPGRNRREYTQHAKRASIHHWSKTASHTHPAEHAEPGKNRAANA
jgi:hypothetical protein